jgi:WW domain-containing oxidoreductase
VAVRTAESITQGVDLAGKTALVTGVNSGIGFETARVLALRGAKVLGTARTIDKARDACSTIEGDTVPLACELTDRDSIRSCVAQVELLELPGIDIVVANAGIMALPELEQVEGIEKQFATNHLGHFLLVNLLLPQIGRSGPARVAIVSSAAHAQATGRGIDFDNLSGEAAYSGWRAYAQSKLANILFAGELAKRLPPGSTANSLHPGMIRTNLARHMSGVGFKLLGLAMYPLTVSVPRGAATSCYVVAHPACEEVSGRYFSACRESTPSKNARDGKLAERLWRVSEELVGLNPGGAMS